MSQFLTIAQKKKKASEFFLTFQKVLALPQNVPAKKNRPAKVEQYQNNIQRA